MCIIRSCLGVKSYKKTEKQARGKICQHFENSDGICRICYPEFPFAPKRSNREKKIRWRWQKMEMLRCSSASGCQTNEEKSSKAAQPESRTAQTITVSMNYELDSLGGRCRLYSKITISPPTAHDSERRTGGCEDKSSSSQQRNKIQNTNNTIK